MPDAKNDAGCCPSHWWTTSCTSVSAENFCPRTIFFIGPISQQANSFGSRSFAVYRLVTLSSKNFLCMFKIKFPPKMYISDFSYFKIEWRRFLTSIYGTAFLVVFESCISAVLADQSAWLGAVCWRSTCGQWSCRSAGEVQPSPSRSFCLRLKSSSDWWHCADKVWYHWRQGRKWYCLSSVDRSCRIVALVTWK